jgi:hypothetical protein
MLGRSTKQEIIMELAFVIWPLNSHDINIPYTIRATQNFSHHRDNYGYILGNFGYTTIDHSGIDLNP